jgi:hypothetical protein
MEIENESLKIIQTLMESTGASIEPYRELLYKKHSDAMSKDEVSKLEEIRLKAFNGFFHCAAQDIIFTDISRIKKFYGRTIEEACPGASHTFMKLAKTYWTFKVLLNEMVLGNRGKPVSSICFGLLQSIDIDFAGVFFPTPGPFGPSKKKREEAMRSLIEMSGAGLDVDDYIQGKFYLQ